MWKGLLLFAVAVTLFGQAGGPPKVMRGNPPPSTICLATDANGLVIAGSCGSGAVPGTQYATSYTSGTGISQAVTACASAPCDVVIPPNYTTSEAVPGFQIDPNINVAATTGGTLQILDNRYGDAQMGNNFQGFHFSRQYAPHAWQYNLYTPLVDGSIYTPLNILLKPWDGGSNLYDSSLSYFNKSTYTPLSLGTYSHTNGQHVGITNAIFHYGGNGDTLGIGNYLWCWGGFNQQADEGCEAQDNQVQSGNVDYVGLLTGSPTTGTTSVTVNPSQGSGTQGSGRYLVDVTKSTSGTALSTTFTASGPSSVTVSGVVGASTATGTLGTAVSTLGAVTVTPTFSTGSIAAISVGTLVCIDDGDNFTWAKASAVTGSTFSYVATKPNKATATFGVAGQCGKVFALTADDISQAGYSTSHQNTIVGTLLVVWPVISSATSGGNTVLSLGIQGQGDYQEWASRFDASTANGYSLYPAAEVVSAQQSGGLSNTLTLSPNSAAWAASDTVDLPLFPAMHVHPGYNYTEQYWPNFANTTINSGWTYNQPLRGSDALYSLSYSAPHPWYSMYGGKYLEPSGIVLGGPLNYGLHLTGPVKFATVTQECDSAISGTVGGCTGYQNILAAANSSAFDFFTYDAANKQWKLSYNSNAGTYIFGSSTFTTPFGAFTGRSGNTGTLGTTTGTFTSGNCVVTDASHNLADGGPCGSASFPFTPTTGGPYYLGATPSGGIATNAYAPIQTQAIPSCATANGICIDNNQVVRNASQPLIQATGVTSDTLRQSDWGGITSYLYGSTEPVGIPAAGLAGNFQAGWNTTLKSVGGISLYSTSAINGTVYTSGSPFSITAGKTCVIYSDGSAFWTGQCN